ncbi:MAG: DUF4124 domain-containing protein [Desulfobacterales bacterium]
MKGKLFFGVFLLIAAMGPDLGVGDIYQWTDKDGVQHFTDGPPPPGAQIVEGLSETPADKPPATTGPAKRREAGAVEEVENEPAGRGSEGAVEDDDNDPAGRQDAGAVEDGENDASDREDYWRRLGWDDGPTDGEGAGDRAEGENETDDRENPGTAEDGTPPTQP